MRGEYPITRVMNSSDKELPPRARRIPDWEAATVADPGTTSACAENTILVTLHKVLLGNYLRVRGEYGFLRRH